MTQHGYHDWLEARARTLQDLCAGGGGPGHGAHVNARVIDQRGAHGAITLNQMDQSRVRGFEGLHQAPHHRTR